MDREIPAPGRGERSSSRRFDPKAPTTIHRSHPTQPDATAAIPSDLSQHARLFEQAGQLAESAKLALICELMADLNADQIQAILEFGQQFATRSHSVVDAAPAVSRTTRLLLKKDYTYQDRGLSEPTQYYVYLRRCKPKLDRYIGTLFYIPQGCTLAYGRDAEGRILFNPPHNIFQLKDSKNHLKDQVVRLICLEPPPPQYTFTKQQDDVPEIHLRLEYLDPATLQPQAEASYAFPRCMYEGGKLDRYRWEVSTVVRSPEAPSTGQSIEPQPKLPTFYLVNDDAAAVLERMQLWASWSEQATPQARCELVQHQAGYTLQNVSSKRRLFSFSPESAAVTLESSLPVLMQWFQNLGLAVSQTQSQKYSAAQLKLARSLFVDMSLPAESPLVALKKLFGVKFTETAGTG
jgi:hypothetical protein